MPVADDLLEQAVHLARRERRKPKQISLRRSISAAYYHLFTTETALNWRIPSQRLAVRDRWSMGK